MNPRQYLISIAACDLLLYRSEKESGLREMQETRWGKVLYLVKDHYGLEFVATRGVMPIKQPPETLAKLERIIAAIPEAKLAALANICANLGSAVLALAVKAKLITIEEAFDCSVVDEKWQSRISGDDVEATARLEAIKKEVVSLALDLLK